MEGRELYKLSDPSHILECIEGWRKLDLRKKTDAEIDKDLKKFINTIKNYSTSSKTLTGYTFWRIRKFRSLIKSVSECWEPPADKTLMGRCNAEKTPVLYLSERNDTPFEELSIEQDEPVYLFKYRQRHELILHNVVSSKFEPTDAEGQPVYDDQSTISYKIWRDFIRSEFLKPVGVGTEYLHRISASLCRVLFNSVNTDGWQYPSVQASDHMNIALKPDSAKEKIQLEDVVIVRLVDIHKAHEQKIISDDVYEYNQIFSRNKDSILITDFKGQIDNNTISWVPIEHKSA